MVPEPSKTTCIFDVPSSSKKSWTPITVSNATAREPTPLPSCANADVR
jgi:hypothetical protein